MDHFILVLLCFCCVLFSFLSTKPTDWLGRTSTKWSIFRKCMGRKTLINQSSQ